MPNEANPLPPWPWRHGEPKGTIIRRAEDAAVGLFALVKTDARVYRKNAQGRAEGGALERYMYEPAEIVGENKISWIVGNGWSQTNYPKVPTERRRARFYGIEDVDDILWRGTHAWRLADHIGRINDVGLLQRIASLTGYQSDRF